MARKLGLPNMFEAAEKIVYGPLAAAQAENGDDHYLAHKQVQHKAADDPTLAGAIVLLFPGTGLEAVNRQEAAPN